MDISLLLVEWHLREKTIPHGAMFYQATNHLYQATVSGVLSLIRVRARLGSRLGQTEAGPSWQGESGEG